MISMTMKSARCAAAAVSLLALPTVTHAQTWQASLFGSNEVPPTASAGTGTATITLTGNSLSLFESFTGITGPATGAHIHCCAPIGTSTGIAVPFLNFPAATSGTYTSTFDLTAAAIYLPAFLAANGGTASGAETALLAGLNSGQAYANIHTALSPAGEIRGQFVLVTPEPSTVVLMVAGLIAVGIATRRRRESGAV
jgi:hypothetical protein